MTSILLWAVFQLASPLACDPASHGAFPDDGISDEVALQAHHDATGCTILRPGVYELRRVPTAKASVVLHGGIFAGSGARVSWLRMVGDGGNGDWAALRAKDGADLEMYGFGFDNSLPYNTDEQTHAIQVGPGIARVDIRDLYFWHPIRYKPLGGVEAGGDCVRIAGEATALVEDWSVADSLFDFCDRSGVSGQRGQRNGSIARNVFRRGTDNDIDFELTGTGDAEDITIEHNVFRKGAPIAGSSNSSYAISLQALATGTIRNVSVIGNRLDRGLEFYDVNGAIVRDNVIVHNAPSGEATVEWRRGSRGQFADNKVTRNGTAGPVARWFYQGPYWPRDVSWRGGILRQNTDASVMVIESCERCSVDAADLQYKGPPGGASSTPAGRYGIRARGTTHTLDAFRVIDISAAGELSMPVWLAPGDTAEVLSLRSVTGVAP